MRIEFIQNFQNAVPCKLSPLVYLIFADVPFKSSRSDTTSLNSPFSILNFKRDAVPYNLLHSPHIILTNGRPKGAPTIIPNRSSPAYGSNALRESRRERLYFGFGGVGSHAYPQRRIRAFAGYAELSRNSALLSLRARRAA